MLEISLTKKGNNEPPEVCIWEGHDFHNEFQIRIRNPHMECVTLPVGWLLQLNYRCGDSAGALLTPNDEKMIKFRLDERMLETGVQQELLRIEETNYQTFRLHTEHRLLPGDEIVVGVWDLISHTESGKAVFYVSYGSPHEEIRTEPFSITKTKFNLEITKLENTEAVGTGYSAPVSWETIGADTVLLNQEPVAPMGERGIFMDQKECEKLGGILVSLTARNKYGASVTLELFLTPSKPLVTEWKVQKEDGIRYCYWNVLYADKIIFNDEEGYQTKDKGACRVEHYGHAGSAHYTHYIGKLRAIGFGGQESEKNYVDMDYSPAVI